MSTFQLAGLLLTAVALLGYFNNKFIKLPDTLGITALAMVSSLAMLVYGTYQPESLETTRRLAKSINFADLVFHGLLSFLLFAGALHVNIKTLSLQRWPVFALATAGVACSTAIVGYTLYYALAFLDIKLSLLWCLAFGALISPTDPVAVLGVLKTSTVPEPLKDKIAGEALFNDATAVVAFMTLVGLASGSVSEVSTKGLAVKLAHEAFGALGLGLLLGFGAQTLIRRLNSSPIEILITLALATGGYSLCEYLHVSAPLGVVVMGLVIGSSGFGLMPNLQQKNTLFVFWQMVDELLNLMLFGLVGLMLIALNLHSTYLMLGVLAIGISLIARYVSVGISLAPFRGSVPKSTRAAILTWGGLRGGVSIALALSLPDFAGKDLLQVMTYIVVAFSLLVQATTLSTLTSRWLPATRTSSSIAAHRED